MPWSDWIDGLEVDTDPTPLAHQSYIGASDSSEVGDPGAPTTPTPPAPNGALAVDARSDLTALLASVLGTVETIYSGGESLSRNVFAALKQGITGSAGFGYSEGYYLGQVTLGQGFLTIQADPPATDYDHSVLDALVEGVDYGPNPDTGQTVDYETPNPTFLNWLDVTFDTRADVLANMQVDSAGDVQVPEGVGDLTVSYRATPLGILVANNGPAPFKAFGDDTALIGVTYPLPAPTPPLGGGPIEEIRGTVDQSVTLPLSMLGDEPLLTIFAQTNLQGDATEPFDDFTVHNFAGSVDVGSPSNGSKALEWNHQSGWLLDHSGNLTTPQAHYRQPRWRYWIPDNVYTVGGHWATPSGVQVMSLKGDGVTWIPVVDGLAPPLR